MAKRGHNRIAAAEKFGDGPLLGWRLNDHQRRAIHFFGGHGRFRQPVCRDGQTGLLDRRLALYNGHNGFNFG